MRPLAHVLLVLAILLAGGPLAWADAESDARREFVAAVQLAKQAETAPSLARRIEMLASAVRKLEDIVLRYPGSSIALDIATGGKIGAVDPAELRRRLTAARLRDPASAPSRLLAAVKQVLDDTLLQGPDAPRLVLAEPLTVVERNETLTVRFRDPRLVFDKTDELVLGDIALNVVPEPAGRYRFSFDLPTRLAVRELPDGPEQPIITAGSASVSGVWSALLQVPTRLSIALDSLRLLEPYAGRQEVVARFGHVKLSFAYADWSRRVWFGPVGLRLADVQVIPEPGLSLEADAVELTGQSDGVSQATWLRVLDLLGIDVARGAIADDVESLSRFVSMFAPLRWGGFDHALTVRGLRLVEDGEALVRVAEAHGRLTLDAAGEAVTLHAAGEVKSMALDDDFGPPELWPTDAAFDLSLEHLPIRSVAMTLLSTAFRLPPVPGRDNIVFDQVDLVDLLHGPQPRLRIDRVEGSNQVLGFGLSGDFLLDPAAREAVTGKADAWAEGLEQTRRRSADADATEALDELIDLGEKEGARHRFRIELDKRGIVSVNGRELGPLEP